MMVRRLFAHPVVAVVGAIVLLGGAPAVSVPFTGYEPLDDREMDALTAAGETAVLSVHGVSEADLSLEGVSRVSLTLGRKTQSGAQALTLNNVVGENQLANAMNIRSAGSGGIQTNAVSQSHGSTVALCLTLGALTCHDDPESPLALDQVITADWILQAVASQGAAHVLYDPVTTMALDFRAGAQAGLKGLTLTNVVGKSQVGNGINLSGGKISLDGTDPQIGPFPSLSRQNNMAGQWRGTPGSLSSP